MRIGSEAIFSTLFVAVISSVLFVQSIKELLESGHLQAADILEDTFVTPSLRMKRIDEQTRRLADTLHLCEQLAQEGAASDRFDECIDDALTTGKNLRQLFVEINRHVSDTCLAEAALLDSLFSAIESLRDAVNEGNLSGVRRSIADVEAGLGALDRCGSDHATLIQPVLKTIEAFFYHTFFNSRYLRSYEKQIEESSFASGKIRPIMQIARYTLLGDLGAKAFAGHRGWLFYRPGMEYLYRPSIYDPRSRSVDYNDKALYDDPVDVIDDFKRQLRDRGVDLMVVIVPDKASIYPDLVNKNIPVSASGKISHTFGVIEKLQRVGVATVNLFTPLSQARSSDSLCGDSLYLVRDTHWRSRALRIAARMVADEVRRRPWHGEPHTTLSYYVDSVLVERTGDIAVMTGLPQVDFCGLRQLFTPEKTKCYRVVLDHLSADGGVFRKEPYRDDFINSRILVMGDSFSRIYQTDKPYSAGWIAHLALELGEPLASIVSDGGASTLVRQKLARKMQLLKGKRLVIWEFTERDLRFGASGWQKIMLPEE